MSGIRARKTLTRLSATLFACAAVIATPFGPSAISPAQAACGDSAGKGVDWADCRKRSLIVSGTDFTEANFTRADLSSSDLRESTLVGASFEKANIVRASLAGSDATGANFNGVIASRTDFSEVNLTNADLGKAEIVRGNFSNSILKNIDMSKGEFFRIEFEGADLADVDFSSSNLARSDFRGATFSGPISMANTFLFLTRLEGLDMSQVSGLQPWQLELACGDDSTVLPSGVARPAAWPCSDDDG